MELDYNKHIELGEGIYWIGFQDVKNALHSNPYIIIEGDEAVVIDGGSRPDFSTVMLKILQIGVKPGNIKALIYHHYDPDLVGSISHFEDVIDSKDLMIISQRHNNVFINHYGTTAKKACINSSNNEWVFKTGRKLKFINTPYAHSPGSFVTYDTLSGTLFTSDIFGSYSRDWELYLEVDEKCDKCTEYDNCPLEKTCFMKGISEFHKLIMTSNKALNHALNQIATLEINRIAPQHGSIIEGNRDYKVVYDKLLELKDIGIDGELKGKIYR